MVSPNQVMQPAGRWSYPGFETGWPGHETYKIGHRRHLQRVFMTYYILVVYTRVKVREPNTFQFAEEYQEEVTIQEEEEKDMKHMWEIQKKYKS